MGFSNNLGNIIECIYSAADHGNGWLEVLDLLCQMLPGGKGAIIHFDTQALNIKLDDGCLENSS